MGVPDPHTDPQFYEGVPMRRFIAFVIDTIAIVLLWLIGVFVFAAVTLGLGAFLAPVLLAMTGFVYRWMTLAQRSATPGMMLTGIEIRDFRGEKLDQSSAFIHTLAYAATLFFLPLAIIGWILMASSPYRRTMHDTFTGAVAINRPA